MWATHPWVCIGFDLVCPTHMWVCIEFAYVSPICGLPKLMCEREFLRVYMPENFVHSAKVKFIEGLHDALRTYLRAQDFSESLGLLVHSAVWRKRTKNARTFDLLHGRI